MTIKSDMDAWWEDHQDDISLNKAKAILQTMRDTVLNGFTILEKIKDAGSFDNLSPDAKAALTDAYIWARACNNTFLASPDMDDAREVLEWTP